MTPHLNEPGLRDVTLRDGLLRSATYHARRPALALRDRTLTYEELIGTARQWASCLVELSGRRPSRVGILSGRNEISYIGVAASVLAGATFVPLNPKFPLDRTRFMVASGALDVVIVDEDSLPQLRHILSDEPDRIPVLAPAYTGALTPCVSIGRQGIAAAPPLNNLLPLSSDDAAYLLFTSGSTGRPKGVPIAHSNALSFLCFNQARYSLTNTDRLSQTFDLTFDLSVFDLFMAWRAGACVFPLQAIELLAPAEFVQRHELTVWFSVPSVAALARRQGLLAPLTMPTLRWSLFCGEGLPVTTAQAWHAAAPNSTLENLYGPTELTIACSAYRWNEESAAECQQELVPIGKLYDGLTGIIVDESLKEVCDGGSGELCVAGPQMFAGYWRAPELTKDRVFEMTIDGSKHRFYRTGDLVRRQPSGGLIYLGRTDQQIKIGGYRVELGEVEASMRRAGCVEAIAVPWPNRERPQGIIGFYSGAVEATQVQEHIRRELPLYMVPRVVQRMEDTPLNANGKISREALTQRAAGL